MAGGRIDSPLRGAPTRGEADAAIKLRFSGAHAQPVLEPLDRRSTHVSYFHGNSPTAWHGDVPVFGGLRLHELYPGIDLELDGTRGGVRPHLTRRPGTGLASVKLRVEGADGVTIDQQSGLLKLSTAVGEIHLPLSQADNGTPLGSVAQQAGNRTFDVPSPFTKSATPPAATWASGSADLLYSTFLGGTHQDAGTVSP